MQEESHSDVSSSSNSEEETMRNLRVWFIYLLLSETHCGVLDLKCFQILHRTFQQPKRTAAFPIFITSQSCKPFHIANAPQRFRFSLQYVY